MIGISIDRQDGPGQKNNGLGGASYISAHLNSASSSRPDQSSQLSVLSVLDHIHPQASTQHPHHIQTSTPEEPEKDPELQSVQPVGPELQSVQLVGPELQSVPPVGPVARDSTESAKNVRRL